MSAYFDNLCKAMSLCAEDPKAIFLGQAVAYPGTAMTNTVVHIPAEKKLEMPVAENLQAGMATGLAIGGYLPICMYPRINFMLCAVDQIVLHLDKLPEYSDGGYNPRVILRTAVPTDKPMDPGPQHTMEKGDYVEAFRHMCRNITIVELTDADDIIPEYAAALKHDGSTLLVEHTSMY